ncbi:DUF3263 domain-containing protein [Ornithinimicrobium sp. LYQ92]|uniref:DUF3263 domain-containing protein n=1 Tax=Serinicoccus sp. LYQ92 TaxID=3378798 RepID=UPI003851A56C
MALNVTDRAILQAAAGTYTEPGGELEAITYASGMSLAKTYQRLNELMADPEAWAADPVSLALLVRRQEKYVRRRQHRRRVTNGA